MAATPQSRRIRHRASPSPSPPPSSATGIASPALAPTSPSPSPLPVVTAAVLPIRIRKHRMLSLLVASLLLFLSPQHTHAFGTGWRPDSELGPFHLGTENIEGVKVKGYEGEWPLWRGFRESLGDSTTYAGGAGSGGGVAAGGSSQPIGGGTTQADGAVAPSKPTENAVNGTWSCRPAGVCQKCPEEVKHLPFCRPYGNRQPLLCTLTVETGAATGSVLAQPQTTQAYESCGKVVKDEARDFLEFVMTIALLAVVSITVFVQRQKVLFQRQNQLLSFRVSGTRQRGGATPARRRRQQRRRG